MWVSGCVHLPELGPLFTEWPQVVVAVLSGRERGAAARHLPPTPEVPPVHIVLLSFLPSCLADW